MALIPEILPAAPEAPGHVRYTSMPLSYGVVGRMILALEVWAERRKLRGLSDWRLADIGRSRDEAEAEARRPIWDVPLHWRVPAEALRPPFAAPPLMRHDLRIF